MDTFFSTTKDNLKSDVIKLILNKKQLNFQELCELVEELKILDIRMDEEQTVRNITFIAMDKNSPEWIGVKQI